MARLIWYPNRAIYTLIDLDLRYKSLSQFLSQRVLYCLHPLTPTDYQTCLYSETTPSSTILISWYGSKANPAATSSHHLRRRCWMPSPSNFNCVVYGKWSSTKVTVLNHMLPSKIHFVKGYLPGCPKKIRRCCVTMVIASVCITTWASQRHIIVLCYKK